MKESIRPKNDKGQLHGYQEWYFNSILELRCIAKNGFVVGYRESHEYKKTTFTIR